MQLHAPFIITPRLAPGLQVGGSNWISFEQGRFVIDMLDTETGRSVEHIVTDFRPPASGHASLQDQFAALLSFLSACAESRQYARGRGKDEMEGENSDLFPSNVGAWAEEMNSEIEMLAFFIEESETELICNETNPNSGVKPVYPKGRWT